MLGISIQHLTDPALEGLHMAWGDPLPAKGEVHVFWILASTLPGHHLLPAWLLLPPSSPSPCYVSNRRLWDSRTI